MRASDPAAGAPTSEEDIATVLAAEQDARQSVAACREAATDTVAAAQARAQRIAARTEARLARLGEAYRKRVADTRAACERVVQGLSPPSDADDTRLRAAVAALAAALTEADRDP